ncbi:hypothetical protein Bca4012_020900 [Brassica carinata]
MKLLVFILLLLVSPLCSSGFEKDNGVTQVSQHSDKMTYNVGNLMDDYGDFNPTPRIGPLPPPHHPEPPPTPSIKNDILQ